MNKLLKISSYFVIVTLVVLLASCGGGGGGDENGGGDGGGDDQIPASSQADGDVLLAKAYKTNVLLASLAIKQNESTDQCSSGSEKRTVDQGVQTINYTNCQFKILGLEVQLNGATKYTQQSADPTAGLVSRFNGNGLEIDLDEKDKIVLTGELTLTTKSSPGQNEFNWTDGELFLSVNGQSDTIKNTNLTIIDKESGGMYLFGAYNLEAEKPQESVSFTIDESKRLTALAISDYIREGEINGDASISGALLLTPVFESTVSTSINGNTSLDAIHWTEFLYSKLSEQPLASLSAN